ncbi:MAG: hypothetical protein JWN41_550 [Thermoleophilia bacterium]|nr:hypothetical protein [Thermoleophilia bacterium]
MTCNEYMGTPLDVEDVASALLHDLADASESGATGLHVQLHVAKETAYEWVDASGTPHEVHLPSKLRAHPMRFMDEPHTDGGPAAVFRIEANGYVPSERVVGMMANQLYQQAVRWGRMRYAPWDAAPSDGLDPLPPHFSDIVEAAIIADVT